MINRKFLYILLVPIFLMALVTSSCDSGGSDGNDSGIQRDGVTIEGALSEVVVANANSANKSPSIVCVLQENHYQLQPLHLHR